MNSEDGKYGAETHDVISLHANLSIQGSQLLPDYYGRAIWRLARLPRNNEAGLLAVCLAYRRGNLVAQQNNERPSTPSLSTLPFTRIPQLEMPWRRIFELQKHQAAMRPAKYTLFCITRKDSFYRTFCKPLSSLLDHAFAFGARPSRPSWWLFFGARPGGPGSHFLVGMILKR